MNKMNLQTSSALAIALFLSTAFTSAAYATHKAGPKPSSSTELCRRVINISSGKTYSESVSALKKKFARVVTNGKADDIIRQISINYLEVELVFAKEKEYDMVVIICTDGKGHAAKHSLPSVKRSNCLGEASSLCRLPQI